MRQVYLIVAGALAGVIVDAVSCGWKTDDLYTRIVATLVLGIACGLLGYAVTMRMFAAGLRRHGPSMGARLDKTALGVSLVAAGLPATWAAAGMEKATLHGYLCVIACEAIALALGWWFGRAVEKQQTPENIK